jgi:hypothetical protein
MTRHRPTAAAIAFLLAAAAAAIAPVIGSTGRPEAAAAGFPGWPSQYEGRALTELPLTAREAAFTRDFPGRIGRFSDGRREIVIRFVTAPTRRLHPAADCYRGIGFAVTPQPVQTDAQGRAMACLQAKSTGETWTVCEQIRDGRDQSWPDVSAWYWHALFEGGTGPWWSFVVAEPG